MNEQIRLTFSSLRLLRSAYLSKYIKDITSVAARRYEISLRALKYFLNTWPLGDTKFLFSVMFFLLNKHQ